MAIGIIANDQKNKLHVTSTNKYYDSSFHVSISDKNESHAIIASNIKPNSIVLDVGCSQGLIGEVLFKELNCKVYGIELDEEAAKIAEKTNCYQKIYKFDITNNNSKEYNDFFNEQLDFDYIIFSDVLEHLVYPDNILYNFGNLLKNNGNVMISLPNIAHYDVIDGLLNEKFNYSEMGILDNTHLRFFTKYSFAEYIDSINDENDYKFELEVIGKTIMHPRFYGQYSMLDEIINQNEDLLALQNIFKLTKISSKKDTPLLKNILNENKINLTEEINNQLLSLKEENKKLNENIILLNNYNKELLDKQKEMQAELNRIYYSRSWRYTEILRKIIHKHDKRQTELNSGNNKKKSVLYLVQSWLNMKNIKDTHIGGTTLHVLELIKNMNDEFNTYVLTSIDNKYVLITFENGQQTIYDLNVDVTVYRYDGYDYNFLQMINTIIDELQIDIVHIHHIINFPCDLQYISNKAKVVLTLHDYTTICPNYFLIDEKAKYCKNALSKKCLNCSFGIDLKTRMIAIENLLKSTEKIIVPDISVAEEIKKYYNFDNFQVIPNGIDFSSFSQFEYNDKNPKKVKNIAFIGGLNINKGSKLAKQIVENNDKEIMYHLFGTSSEGYLTKNHKNYIYHGLYNKKDLPKLLNDNHIDLVLMLSICPESFSYVLSEVAYSKIPVVALDIGAIGNRVKEMNIGLTVKYESNYKDIINCCKKIFKNDVYLKYIKSLENVKIYQIKDMVYDVIKIYNNIHYQERKKDFYTVKNNIKKYRIKYKFKYKID